MKKLLSILIITMLAVCRTLSQTAYDYDPDELLQAIDSRFTVLDTLIFASAHTPAQAAQYSKSLIDIDTPTDREANINTAITNRVNAEIAQFKSDLGLQVTGQTYYRLDGVMGNDEEDPVSAYNGKVQVEARWYLLQSSLYKREGNIQAIRIQGDIDRTIQERDRMDLSVYRQKEYFRHLSDSLLSGVLQHRIANLTLLTQANLYLLQHGAVSSDELLKVLDDKAGAQRQLATLDEGMPAATDLSGVESYVIDVDTARLIRHIKDSAVDVRLLGLRMQLLEQQEANTSYWSKCNLAPFVRYSYYMRDYAPNSSNIDAGLSFTIPINDVAAHQRRTIHAQRQVLEAESVDLMRVVNDRIRYYANEISRLNRASAGEAQRIAELKAYLRVRAQAYDNRNGEYNRLSRLKEYNNYLICLERLIEQQYQRDCYVADLQRLLTDGSILQYCTVRQIVNNQAPVLLPIEQEIRK